MQPPWYRSDRSFSSLPNSFYVTVTKLGLVQRFDEAPKKRASSISFNPQQLGLILTDSQLYLVWLKVAEQVRLHLEGVSDRHRVTGLSPTTTFNLEHVTAYCDVETDSMPFAFKVRDENRVLILQATTEEERRDWLTKINVGATCLWAKFSRGAALGDTELQVLTQVQQDPFRKHSTRDECLLEHNIRDALLMTHWTIRTIEPELSVKQHVARHYSLLKPFLPSMRDRMRSACKSLGHNVRELHLRLLKYRIRRTILLLPWGVPSKKSNTTTAGLASTSAMPASTIVQVTGDSFSTSIDKKD